MVFQLLTLPPAAPELFRFVRLSTVPTLPRFASRADPPAGATSDRSLSVMVVTGLRIVIALPARGEMMILREGAVFHVHRVARTGRVHGELNGFIVRSGSGSCHEQIARSEDNQTRGWRIG